MSDKLTFVEHEYPVLVPDYYLLLAEAGADVNNDPILKQCMPDAAELADDTSSEDPFAEDTHMPVPRLIHRYPDRAVLLTTGRCAMHCRFCFRKRYWKRGSELADITMAEFFAIIKYLHQNPGIREILISGGEPLLLPSDFIERMVDELFALPAIEAVRIGTRLPVVDPHRIDLSLTTRLKGKGSLWLMTHFNHPREVTPIAAKVCGLFADNGIPVLNQTVLLAGVNDQVDILEDLFRKLVKGRIKPHYLFHVDPVRGVRHFETGIEKGLDLMRELRLRLSSLALPVFALDLPDSGGKVRLEPEILT
jgi:lysine 2,3-aminomutase